MVSFLNSAEPDITLYYVQFWSWQYDQECLSIWGFFFPLGINASSITNNQGRIYLPTYYCQRFCELFIYLFIYLSAYVFIFSPIFYRPLAAPLLWGVHASSHTCLHSLFCLLLSDLDHGCAASVPPCTGEQTAAVLLGCCLSTACRDTGTSSTLLTSSWKTLLTGLARHTCWRCAS